MKKIRKQKKNSKLIEKIFRCEKQERDLTKSGSQAKQSVHDPYALKPIQETGMSGVSSVYLQPEKKDSVQAPGQQPENKIGSGVNVAPFGQPI